jgi:invasion protein IalB
MGSMNKTKLTRTILSALAALVILTGPALAQTPGAPADGVGSTFVKSTHGAWEIRCLRLQGGGERCQMFQQLNQADGNPVAEMNIFSITPGQAAAAGAVILTPLETLLTSQLGLTIDGAPGNVIPSRGARKLAASRGSASRQRNSPAFARVFRRW